MTDQVPDKLIYKKLTYFIKGIKGDNYITPQKFGIETKMASTACRRGYIMIYSVKNDQFFLDDMCLRTNKLPPIINHVEPKSIEKRFNYSYKMLNIKTSFSGKLLLMYDFSNVKEKMTKMEDALPKLMVLHIENGDISLIEDVTKKPAIMFKFR